MKGKINTKKLFKKLMTQEKNWVKHQFHVTIQKNWLEMVMAIEGLILKGISPVFGKRKFQRYSQSYIEQIKGNIKYFTNKNTGGVFSVEPKMTSGEQTSIRFTKGGKVKAGRTKKAEFEKFEKGLGKGKMLRPVNMKLTGEMLDSLRLGIKNGQAKIWFDDIKAAYHNDGAKLWHGGELPERRLLPNRPGEKFHKNVFKLIRQYANEAIERAFKTAFK